MYGKMSDKRVRKHLVSYVKEVVKQGQSSGLTFSCMSVVWGLDCVAAVVAAITAPIT